MLIKKILIGVDNTKFSENAARYGFDIAQKFKARVGLVHIVEPVVMPYNNSTDPLMGTADLTMPDAEIIDVQNDASKTLLENMIARFGEGLEVTSYNQFGDTADGILNCSIEFGADMIVLGTHSRTGFDRLLMGSIAESVLRQSDVPVLVVPLHETAEQ